MTKQKSIKRALLLSGLALIVCISMLIGSTFAWFTDSVTSGRNIIATGNLDVEMEYLLDGKWKSVNKNTELFDKNALWEPGYTEVVYLRVYNAGNLAFKYRFGINIISQVGSVNVNGDSFLLSDFIKFSVVEGVKTPFATSEDARTVAKTPISMSDGYSKESSLMPDDEPDYVALVVYMPETVGNEANYATGETPPHIEFGVKVEATQETSEFDSFGSDYDSLAFLSGIKGPYEVSASVKVKNGVTIEETVIGRPGDKFTAVIPVGVKVGDGVSKLTLKIHSVKNQEADVQLRVGQIGLSLDVHIEGVAEDNTVPMTINLGAIAPVGLYNNNIILYHVEDSVTNQMTQVAGLEVLDAHNEFYYDAKSGIITITLASFSEVYAAISYKNPWDGSSFDLSWYNADAPELTVDTAADLFGFAQIVGGMAKDEKGNVIQDDFAGQTVKLGANINLGEKIWYPIGYYNTEGNYEFSGKAIASGVKAFCGTFDGNGYTIANFHQNTWEMKGDNNYYPATEQRYRDAMGLFGLIENGHVKNLVIDQIVTEGEFTDVGAVTAYARGTCTFDNIRIANASCYSYNCRTAGIVGYDWVGNTVSNFTFSNIEIDPTSTFGALWGSWDVACAGILGYMNDASTVKFVNCEVGCKLDVFNDVCANYQYYDYRYAGMMIGTVGKDGDTSDMPGKITFDNCSVYYGDWINHYHCELVANSEASYTHDYQMSRLDRISSLGNIQDNNGNWKKTGNFLLISGTEKTCYHIVKDANGNLREYKHEEAGTEIIDGKEVLVEDKQIVHTVFNQIYTGYGWGAVSVAEKLSIKKTIYTITYINSGKVLDVTYITDNSSAKSTTHSAAQKIVEDWAAANIEGIVQFGGWVNAGSKKISEVPKNNTVDIVLYPSFEKPYTARFVDLDGNVLSWCFFNESDTSKLETTRKQAEDQLPKQEHVEFVKWQVKDSNGNVKDYKVSDFVSYGDDVTIYPLYQYSGNLNLVPVDENSDGKTDYYRVEAVDKLDTVTTIPGYVLGVPVKIVTKLYKNDNNFDYGSGVKTIIIGEGVEILEKNSLAHTADLDTVKLPSTITTLGKNVFSRNNTLGSIFGQDDKKVLTIEYNGTKQDWDNINKHEDWHNGLKSSSVVKCVDGTYTLKVSLGNYKWTWTPNA